jgi:transcriptional regulator with XRE-family HTH domain
MKLGQKIHELRKARKMSLRDVTKASGDELGWNLVWRYEKGKYPVTARALKLLKKAFNIPPGSELDKELNSMWTSERVGDISPTQLNNRMTGIRLQQNLEAEQLFKNIAALDEATLTELAKALKRPAVMKALKSLNAIYETK